MLEELEGRRVLQGFFQGASTLIDRKEELNKINVFPVADGDTGSNLASLMQAILDGVSPNLSSLEVILTEVADAALLGARGNSGIIFAQYLNGIAQAFEKTEKNADGFVQSLNHAVSEAYQALLEPKEGTILTVIRTWAEAVHKAFFEEHSLEKALISARTAASQAMNQTEFQLEILRKNRLVDSGAKGFYLFIEGFTVAFSGHLESRVVEKTELPITAFQTEMVSERPLYRYCTELLVKNVAVEKDVLQEKLKNAGDSLILAGNRRVMKLHIHTNHPRRVLNVVEQYGELTQQKVDDMLLQFEVNNQRKYPIALVTDSIADLPEEFLLEEQVHVLPMDILVGETSYLDKLTIDSSLIKEKSNGSEKLSTAQPTLRSVDALLSFLEDKYEAILVVTVSSQLSGTYQLVNQRAKAKGLTDEKFQVIDSQLNSAAQGLLIQEAVQLIKREIPFKEVCAEVRKIRERCFIYVAVADLTPMLESGRIPKKIGRWAQRLHLYPIVSLDSKGNGKLSGIAFSQQHSVKKIVKKIRKLQTKNQLRALAIAHADNSEEAKRLGTLLDMERFWVEYIVESSAAITGSAGVGSVAIAGIKKEAE